MKIDIHSLDLHEDSYNWAPKLDKALSWQETAIVIAKIVISLGGYILGARRAELCELAPEVYGTTDKIFSWVEKCPILGGLVARIEHIWYDCFYDVDAGLLDESLLKERGLTKMQSDSYTKVY